MIKTKTKRVTLLINGEDIIAFRSMKLACEYAGLNIGTVTNYFSMNQTNEYYREGYRIIRADVHSSYNLG